MKADKGNITVVFDACEIDKLINEQLDNPKQFKKLLENPLPKFSKIVKKCAGDLLKARAITGSQFNLITNQAYVDPHVFPRVKIHKGGHPIRLITVSKQGVNEALAELIKPILKQVIGCQYTVKNAKPVKEEMEKVCIPLGGCMVSFDVEKLYPSISQKLILETLKEVLEKPNNEHKLNGFTVNQLLEIVSVVFQTSYVTHKGASYLQVGGGYRQGPHSQLF